MRCLDKADSKRKAELSDQLDYGYEGLTSAITIYNTKIVEAWAPVEDAINMFNELVNNGQEFRDEVVNQMVDYTADKSEAWTEGERGQAYEEWKGAWEEASLEPIELEQPKDIDIDGFECADTLRDLEEEPAL